MKKKNIFKVNEELYFAIKKYSISTDLLLSRTCGSLYMNIS